MTYLAEVWDIHDRYTPLGFSPTYPGAQKLVDDFLASQPEENYGDYEWDITERSAN